MQMLNDRHQDLLKCVSAGIDATITELPAKLAKEAHEMSKDIMEEAMRKALVEYWEHGAGREMIDASINEKFKGSLNV